MADIQLVGVTTNSITVRMAYGSNVSSDYKYINVYCNNGDRMSSTSFSGSAGNVSSGHMRFSGLNSGQTYSFTGQAYVINREYPVGGLSATTDRPSLSSPTAYYEGYTISGSNIRITISYTSDINTNLNQVSCNITGTNYFQGDYVNTSGSNIAKTWIFPAPTSSGNYVIKYSASDREGGNSGIYTTNVYISVDTQGPGIYGVSWEQVGVNLRGGCSALDDSGVSSISVSVSTPNSTANWGNTANISNGGTRLIYSDANGQPFVRGSRYYMRIIATDTRGYSSTYVSGAVLYTITRPTTWSWTSTELNAFNNHGATTTLTYTRWNSFLDNIVAVRNWYYNNTAGEQQVSGARVSSSNKTFTATKFNIAKNAIGSINPTGIQDVSTGSVCYGSYFITLRDKLNGIN